MTIRKQVGKALTGAGFDVVEAVDGADALEKSAGADFSVVICDVNMPNMDGIEFLEAAAKRGGQQPSVIMLTTEAQTSMMDRARKAGAKGWMLKPFKPELLVAAAQKLCGV